MLLLADGRNTWLEPPKRVILSVMIFAFRVALSLSRLAILLGIQP